MHDVILIDGPAAGTKVQITPGLQELTAEEDTPTGARRHTYAITKWLLPGAMWPFLVGAVDPASLRNDTVKEAINRLRPALAVTYHD